MGVEAYAAQDYDPSGVRVSIVQEGHEGRTILRFKHDEFGVRSVWEPMPYDVENPPTLRLRRQEARALYDALAELFEGAVGDARVARADLLHERGRVDKLLEHVTLMAWQGAQQP